MGGARQSTGEQMAQRNIHDKLCAHTKHDKLKHMASKTNYKPCENTKRDMNTHAAHDNMKAHSQPKHKLRATQDK